MVDCGCKRKEQRTSAILKDKAAGKKVVLFLPAAVTIICATSELLMLDEILSFYRFLLVCYMQDIGAVWQGACIKYNFIHFARIFSPAYSFTLFVIKCHFKLLCFCVFRNSTISLLLIRYYKFVLCGVWCGGVIVAIAVPRRLNFYIYIEGFPIATIIQINPDWNLQGSTEVVVGCYTEIIMPSTGNTVVIPRLYFKLNIICGI